MPGEGARGVGEPISYEQWGVDFFAEAVSAERILGAVDGIAGQPIEFGPLGVGPGKIAKVRARGAVGAATATRLAGPAMAYRIELPVDLTFWVDLQVETHTYHADLVVPLVVTAQAVDGVRILMVIDPPQRSEVRVKVTAAGLRASIVQRVANIEGEVQRFVARYVAREVTKPHIEAARTIDVSAAIDRAWAMIAPRGVKEQVTDDLLNAVEAEIRENEDTILDL